MTEPQRMSFGDLEYEVVPPWYWKGTNRQWSFPGQPPTIEIEFIRMDDCSHNIYTCRSPEKAVETGIFKVVGPRPLTLRERIEKILVEWTPTTWQEGSDIHDDLRAALEETK